MPENVAAQVLTRSSYGRLGLLTATAVQVQPGSRGCITLELVNQGETPIALTPAARVAQLMLWFVHDPCEVKPGKYRFPVGPEFSKVASDPDSKALRELGSPEHHEPDPGPEQFFLVRFDPDDPLAESFYEIAENLGGSEVPASPRVARLAAAEISASMLGIAVSVKILALTIQRWIQGQKPGVIVELEDERVVVRVDRRLPSNSVVINDGNGVKLETLSMPPDTPEDLAQVLRALRGG